MGRSWRHWVDLFKDGKQKTRHTRKIVAWTLFRWRCVGKSNVSPSDEVAFPLTTLGLNCFFSGSPSTQLVLDHQTRNQETVNPTNNQRIAWNRSKRSNTRGESCRPHSRDLMREKSTLPAHINLSYLGYGWLQITKSLRKGLLLIHKWIISQQRLFWQTRFQTVQSATVYNHILKE